MVGGDPVNYVDELGLSKGRGRSYYSNHFQPIINGQVQGLVNQIRHFDPFFNYHTARPSRGPNANLHKMVTICHV
jgi:hypothetical protein